MGAFLGLFTAVLAAWTTRNNALVRDGKKVVLHGMGTSCSEYLLRGIGMKCWAEYQWNKPSEIIVNTNEDQINAMISYFDQVNATGTDYKVMPVVRIPMTA